MRSFTSIFLAKIVPLIIAVSLVVGLSIGLSLNASAQVQSSIPNWIRNTAKFWSNGEVSDAEYIKTLQWLIDQKIIKVPQSTNIQNKVIPKQTTPPTYINKVYNFSMLQPVGWTEKENTLQEYGRNNLGYTVLFTLPKNESGYATNINVNVKTFPAIQTTPINQIRGSFENGLHSAYATQDYFQVTKKGSLTVNGKNSFFFEYGAKINGTFVASKQVVIPDGDKAFIITYASEKEDYDAYLSQFTKILSSFKILS